MSDEVEKIAKIGGSGDVAKATQKIDMPNQDYFEALMNQSTSHQHVSEANSLIAEQAKTVGNSEHPSLMDVVKTSSQGEVPSVSQAQLIEQTQEASQKIGKIKEVLSTPNLSVKMPFHGDLQNRLTHIDENLKIALSKAGAEFQTGTATSTPQGLVNPIERYLGYLTSSQDQLANLGSQLKTMSDNKQELNPANMLAIQIKVGTIQTELEFFTGVLNKALDSTKTLMNVQV